MKAAYTLFEIGFIIGAIGLVISIAGVMLNLMTILPSMICLGIATVFVTISMIIGEEDDYDGFEE